MTRLGEATLSFLPVIFFLPPFSVGVYYLIKECLRYPGCKFFPLGVYVIKVVVCPQVKQI